MQSNSKEVATSTQIRQGEQKTTDLVIWTFLTKKLLKTTPVLDLIKRIETSIEILSDEQWKDGYPDYIFEEEQDG